VKIREKVQMKGEYRREVDARVWSQQDPLIWKITSIACGYPSGESRSAATAVASAGVDANADYESAAGSGDERRPGLEEKTVQRARVSTVREMMDWPVA
jgi:hypothetical protein